MKQVVDRSLVQTNAQDLLAQVATGNEDRAKGIAQSYGDQSRQSEMGLLQQRAQLNGATGFVGGKPPGSKDVIRAGLVDALVKGAPGRPPMTRQEALRLVEVVGF